MLRKITDKEETEINQYYKNIEENYMKLKKFLEWINGRWKIIV